MVTTKTKNYVLPIGGSFGNNLNCKPAVAIMAPHFSKLVSKLWKLLSKRKYTRTPRKHALTSRKYALTPEKNFKESCYEIFKQFSDLWLTPSPGVYNDTNCYFYTEQMDAEGLGRKLLLTPSGDPHKTPEK